jgi:hypothetical protein
MGGRDPGPPTFFIPRGNFLLGGSGRPERYTQLVRIWDGSKRQIVIFRMWRPRPCLTLALGGVAETGTPAPCSQPSLKAHQNGPTYALVQREAPKHRRSSALKLPRRSLGPLSFQVSQLRAPHARSRTNCHRSRRTSSLLCRSHFGPHRSPVACALQGRDRSTDGVVLCGPPRWVRSDPVARGPNE